MQKTDETESGDMPMQMISDKNNISSLLTYLMGSADYPAARLSLAPGGLPVEEKSYPFCIVNDSGPITRLVGASFVTDAGTILKRVFFLMSRDRYCLRDDELWPVTNLDIDAAWQHAFSINQGERDDGCRIILSSQIDNNNNLKLISSLFYCKAKQLFFQPPCPLCGLPLELCKDDSLLDQSGLQPYSRSLKRYLYCKKCASQGKADFYVRELDHNDPQTLKDKWMLINEFGQLRKVENSPVDFPCIRCHGHDECYGSKHAAHSRIIPFSFFPFYLLIFEDLSLNSVDFLALVSGATFAELENNLSGRNETGRLECLREIRRQGLMGGSLFSPGDGRYFLEVLYLKLSFLGDVMRQLFNQPDILKQTDMRLTTDRIWVKLPDQSGFLPSCWNFKTKVIDFVNPPDLMGLFSKYSASNLLFYLGLLWFQVFLVNKKQCSKEVFLALKDGVLNNGRIPSVTPEADGAGVYLPGQIFWVPDDGKVSPAWFPIWEKSLALGFSLLQSAIHTDPQWSYGEFFDQFEKIRAEVKKNLFGGAGVVKKEATGEDMRAGDDAVYEILTKIHVKWRERLTSESKSQQGGVSLDKMETLILSPEESALLIPSPREEEITETIILSSSTAHAMLDTLVPGKTDPDVPETVILSPGMRQPGTVEAGDAGNPEEAAQSGGGRAEDKNEEADLMTETVVLPSRKTAAKGNTN